MVAPRGRGWLGPETSLGGGLRHSFHLCADSLFSLNPQISGSHLRIARLSPADLGEYVCRVSLGSLTREASVLVSRARSSSSRCGAPGRKAGGEGRGSLGAGGILTTLLLSPAFGVAPPVRIEASSAVIAEGQTLELDCVVSRPERAMVTWYRRGEALPAHHQVQA